MGIIFSYVLCIFCGLSIEVDSCLVMGDEKGMIRKLLECSFSDKLCGKYGYYRCLFFDFRMMEVKIWIDFRIKVIWFLVEMKRIMVIRGYCLWRGVSVRDLDVLFFLF